MALNPFMTLAEKEEMKRTAIKTREQFYDELTLLFRRIGFGDLQWAEVVSVLDERAFDIRMHCHQVADKKTRDEWREICRTHDVTGPEIRPL